MKIKLTKLDALIRKLFIQDKLKDLSEDILIAAKKIQSQVNIDGFRKGKAPLNIVKEKYYEFLHNQVIDDLVQSMLSEAINVKKIQLVSRPDVQEISQDNGKISFSATFEVQPELKIKLLKKQKFSIFAANVSEQDINKQIEYIQSHYKDWKLNKDTNLLIQLGDKVLFDLAAYVAEDAENPQFKQEDVECELGSNTVFKEIEQAMVGSKLNELVKVNFTFPKSHSNKDLAGKDFIFNIQIKRFYQPELLALDEALFSKMNVSSLAELQDNVKKSLLKSLTDQLYAINRSFIFNELFRASDFDVPQFVLQNEIKSLKENKKVKDNQISQLGLKRVKMSYIFSDIIKEYKLEVGDDDVSDFLKKEISDDKNLEQTIKETYKNKNQLNNLKHHLLERKLVDLIINTAKVSRVNKTYQEVMEYRYDK